MKPFNKEEYNKLCAEFLGAWVEAKEQPNSYWENLPLSSKIYPQTKDLLFDSDWNWIMEVIEKIESLKYEFISFCHYNWHNPHRVTIQTYQHYEIINTFAESKKEAVIQAIWQFLNWRNETNNKQNNP